MTLREQAIDAAGQPALERILADAAHHDTCASQSQTPEGAIAHSSMAAGLRIAAEHVRLSRDTELEASQRRAVRIQELLDDTRDRIRKLHRPVEYRGRVICVECSGYCGESTDNGPFEHPCATVAALEPPKETPDA